MGKILVIVESGGKIESLKKIFGPDYIIMASGGHIMDLPKESMSIDVNDKFKAKYIIKKDKFDTVKKLQQCAKKCDDVFLATDKDREGEMIAYNLAEQLDLDEPKRLEFTSITETDLLKAADNPGTIDMNMVNAQKTRRFLDRIVGYSLSPLLWKIKRELAAGRVQSVVVKLIVEKEREIKTFYENKKDISYYIFRGMYNGIRMSLCEYNDKKGELVKTKSKEESDELLISLSKSKYKIKSIDKKEATQNPQPPFNTYSLQKEASMKLNMSGKATMDSAERLYQAGYITYLRTDSVTISVDHMQAIKKYVISEYTKDYHRQVQYKNKGAHIQGAHEAIQPTKIEVKSSQINLELIDKRLYDLIRNRTLASQMVPAVYDCTDVLVSISKSKDKIFHFQKKILKFDGFLKVYKHDKPTDNDDNNGDDNDNNDISDIKLSEIGETINLDDITYTQQFIAPPQRYSETSLKTAMDPEHLNIGRPATIIDLVTKIQKNYIIKQNIEGIEKDVLTGTYNFKKDKITHKENKIMYGEEKGKLIPTELGFIVTDYLNENFSKIMDYEFTADMEDKLDQISVGKLKWLDVMNEFYKMLSSGIENVAGKKINAVKDMGKLLGVNPNTGLEVYIGIGKYGPYVSMREGNKKPVCAPIKEPLTVENITINDAIILFEFPKSLGKYEKKEVILQKGKYGLYIKYGTEKIPLKDSDANTFTLNDAINCITKNTEKYLWQDGIYKILTGPYGRYIQVGSGTSKKNVKLPDNIKLDDINVDKIKEIISESHDKPKYSPGRGRGRGRGN